MKNHRLQGSTSEEVNVMNSCEFYQKNTSENNEIDLGELWSAIWAGKLLIIVISGLFTLLSIIYAINQPNIYKATTLLAPANEQGGVSGLAKMASQFGGLANLAGISLGSSGSGKVGLALETLKSRAFIEKFIEKHEILVPLMAAEDWDMESNELLIDKDIYHVETKAWIREVKLPRKPKPSNWEAFEKFKDVLTISTDKESGMVTIDIEHYSPLMATEWLFMLVRDINATMRQQDKAEAQRSIDYLTVKLQETQLADMQTVFYQLIEEQTKIIMLAEASQEYVLKTIDPANAPEEKARPHRALIVVLGAIIGGILSIIFVLIRYFTLKASRR